MRKTLSSQDLIKKVRQKRSLTQRELAQELGKGLRTLGRWERGQRLPDADSYRLLLRLAGR